MLVDINKGERTRSHRPKQDSVTSGCNENEVFVAHSRGLIILVSIDVVKCFIKQRCFPPLRSKLVFYAKFVKKKYLYCFVNQRGQLISRLKTKNRFLVDHM